ncbi:MAG: hypothetical protein R3D69_19265 [Xanthobacteraceae bacterium]
MPSAINETDSPLVRAFHQILIWPLHLVSSKDRADGRNPWDILRNDPAQIWKEVDDEFGTDLDSFSERHYREFVTFLPYVQRLFYGVGLRRSGGSDGESLIKVYRRSDIAKARVVFSGRREPVTVDMRHIDLYFFHDLDLAILVVEVCGADMPLGAVQNMLHSFGRAYPAGWDSNGHGLSCPRKTEWLAADGRVLATSNYEDRHEYMTAVLRERAPGLASHWQYLLKPLVADHSDQSGKLRFRQLEGYRMPLMAYLAVDRLEDLTRSDYIRIAYTNAPGNRNALPYSERHLAEFEQSYCYDKYFDPSQFGEGLSIRIMCHDHAFLMVGDATQPIFTDAEQGILGQFRHQYFLLALIVHMHKAALLMLSNRMVQTVNDLDTERTETVRRFRTEIRTHLENFLRFTHRYWFQEVSDQVQARNVYHILVSHIGTERLYADIRDELQDMSAYLDSDLLRRQSMTFLRLTVVTIVGLIWTSVTGFLGMNLISAALQPLAVKVLYFVVTTALFTAITVYTLAKSQRLANFLDAVTNERMSLRAKSAALLDIWRRKR